MTPTEHIGWEVLLDHVESGSPLPTQLAAHLARCAPCGAMRRDAESLIGALEIATSPEPTQDQIRAAWQAVRAELASGAARRSASGAIVAGAATAAAGFLRELWATLVPQVLVPSHALRGVAATPLLAVYDAGDFVVSVSLKEKDHATQSVLGKIVPRAGSELPAGGVVLRIGEAPPREADLGPHGAFRFDDVPREPVQIDVRIGDLMIHLPAMGPTDPTG